jgi:nucleotide-binding universal stress UspA family protein
VKTVNWKRPPPRLWGVARMAHGDTFLASDARAGRAFAREAPAQVRTILVPTDYSDPSRGAFELACRLSRHGAGRLTLLHVADPPRAPFGMAEGPQLPAGYRGAWESRLNLIRPRDPAVPVEYRIEEGNPAAAILRVAGETASDLIVMGRRRKAGLDRLLRGAWPGGFRAGRVARCSH